MQRKTILLTQSISEPGRRWNAVGGWDADFDVRLSAPIRSASAYLCSEMSGDPLRDCLLALSWFERDDGCWLAEDARLESHIKCEYDGRSLSLKSLYLQQPSVDGRALPEVLFCYLVIVGH